MNGTRQAEFANVAERTEGRFPHQFVDASQQREEPRNLDETEAFPNYIERNNAELIRRIHAIMHMATSLATDIDGIIEETRRTPFMNMIDSIRLHDVRKIKFPEYSRNIDPKAHVRAFRLAISRVHLNDDEK